MTRVGYFECFAGASGDMLLGALLGTGVDHAWFIDELKKIKDIQGSFEVLISNVIKKGISSVNVEVKLTHHEHHHRNLKDIINIINSSDIDEKAKSLAINIFTNLAKAEAKVHGADIDQVHFHEVGAVDSIVDIVGFSILFIALNIDHVIVSPVNTGFGFVECEHGIMPVPAPATLEIINLFNWPIDNSVKVDRELLTPTGAAILTTINKKFGIFPNFTKIESVSYGAGKRDLSQVANVLRFTVGTQETVEIDEEKIWVLETNIDDMQPEFYDFVLEKLLKAGASDVFITPIIMKKTRPANVLSVICAGEIKENIEKVIFEETTTLGIRSYKVNRTVLTKEFIRLNINDLGEITIKVSKDLTGKVVSLKPEYEDCARIAREKNIPLKQVYELISKYYKD